MLLNVSYILYFICSKIYKGTFLTVHLCRVQTEHIEQVEHDKEQVEHADEYIEQEDIQHLPEPKKRRGVSWMLK